VVATSFPVASVERTAEARPLVNQVVPVKVWLVLEAFNIVRALVKVEEACEMKPFWKVAILVKVEVAKELIPEKVLLSERRVEDAAVLGHELWQFPLRQMVFAEKTEDEALPKVARPVNQVAPEKDASEVLEFVKLVIAVWVEEALSM